MGARQSDASRGKTKRAGRKQDPGSGGWTLLGLVPQARRLLGDNRLAVDFLASQFRSLRELFERQVESTVKRLERRIDSMLSELESRTARRLEPLLARAEVARKQDLWPVDHRLGRLEERIRGLIEEQNRLAISTGRIEREWQGLRVDLNERLADSSERVAELERLRGALEEVRESAEKLAKEGLGRAVEAAKVNDRLVRVEMRLADIARQCDALASAQRELDEKLVALGQRLHEETGKAGGAAEEVAMLRAEVEDVIHRVSGLSDLQQANRYELDRLSSLLRNRENSLDARLSEVIERQRRAAAELGELAGKIFDLEKKGAASGQDSA